MLRRCILLLCIWALPALATQIEFRSLPQLAEDAQLVVQGRVRNVHSYWNDAHTRILTEVEIETSRSHKGSAAQSIRLVQVGGVVDGVRMTVHGAPAWPIDQEVLVFVEPSLPGRYRLSGFTQGRFELEQDPSSGKWIAKRSLLGIEIAGKEQPELRMPLDVLLQEAFAQEGGR